MTKFNIVNVSRTPAKGSLREGALLYAIVNVSRTTAIASLFEGGGTA
jgi:hypothetical protein